MNSSLEVILFEVSKASSTSKNLGLYYILHGLILPELLCHKKGFLSVECYISEWDGNLELVK